MQTVSIYFCFHFYLVGLTWSFCKTKSTVFVHKYAGHNVTCILLIFVFFSCHKRLRLVSSGDGTGGQLLY